MITHERFGCPFCGAQVGVIIVPALRAFELHLDVHMAQGDRLLAQPKAPSLLVAS